MANALDSGSTLEQALRVRTLARIFFVFLGTETHSHWVLLFSQVYKWSPANLMLGDGLASHLVGSRNVPSRSLLQNPRNCSGPLGYLSPDYVHFNLPYLLSMRYPPNVPPEFRQNEVPNVCRYIWARECNHVSHWLTSASLDAKSKI